MTAGWSEREMAQDFAAQIERDFEGDLPLFLGLEPLAVRDAAWREAQDTPQGARAALSSSPPELRTSITKREGRIPSQSGTLTVPVGPLASPPRTKGSSTWVLVVVAALAAVAAIAALLVVLLRPADTATQKLVVVEKQVEPDAVEPAASAAPLESAAVPGPAASGGALGNTAAAPPPSAARGPATKPDSPRGAPLARAFQRREGAIQRCFQQSPEGIEGSPRLAVKFNVDRDGHVVSAGLDPAGVAGQPLGRCILGVARATEFGPQPEAVSFSIPIAARVVRH